MQALRIDHELEVHPVRQDRFLGREVVVERALGHVGLQRDLLHGGRVVALGFEQAHGGGRDVVERLGAAALAAAWRFWFGHGS
ncbi:hypothetical protein D9M69_683070 [compost metagenome]